MIAHRSESYMARSGECRAVEWSPFVKHKSSTRMGHRSNSSGSRAAQKVTPTCYYSVVF